MIGFREGERNAAYARINRELSTEKNNPDDDSKADFSKRAGNEEIWQIPTNRLPCLASDVYGLGMDRPIGWSPTVRTMMAGLSQDSPSILSKLGGSSDHIMPDIFKYVSRGSDHVTLTIPASRVGFSVGDIIRYNEGRKRRKNNLGFHEHPKYETVGNAKNATEVLGKRVVAFASCGFVKFPEPQNINVNMMPFVIGDRHSLPPQLHPYYDNLVRRCPYDESDAGKVGYISVQESVVEAGKSQRRAGLHIDSPGVFEDRTSDHDRGKDVFYPGAEHCWGMVRIILEWLILCNKLLPSNCHNSARTHFSLFVRACFCNSRV